MDNKPKGETAYKNYDPEEVNTVDDAIELFRWLSDQNKDRDNPIAESVYRDCAAILEDEVNDDD